MTAPVKVIMPMTTVSIQMMISATLASPMSATTYWIQPASKTMLTV